MNRIDVIQFFVKITGAKTYLEIGVRYGDSFIPVRCENKIGVDIHLPHTLKGQIGTFYETPSDIYFDCFASHFDVAFVDGDHSYEQSLRDVENCLKWMNPNGVILLHDCNPTKEEWATPEPASLDWCGEVWKTILTLRTNPNLYVATLDTDYGIGIVRNGAQESLSYTREQIEKMTYKDLDENRFEFLNLIGVIS